MRLPFVVLACCVSAVMSQIPFLGWCPEYTPMRNFDVDRFFGRWYESERYFTVAELGTRCVASDYGRKPDGNIWVSNEITNAFTGVKRIIDGQLQMTGQAGEGKMLVRYTSLPVPLDTAYSILDTDYDSFAVVYNCNGIGPVHAQSAWVLTRERNAPPLVLQRAYGVLDNYKISRTFFIKTNQNNCAVLAPPEEAIDPLNEEDPDAVRQEPLKEPSKNKGKEPSKTKYPQKPSKLDYQEDKPQDLLQDEKVGDYLNEKPQDKPLEILPAIEAKPHDKPAILVDDKPKGELQEFLHDTHHHQSSHSKPIEMMHAKLEEHLKDGYKKESELKKPATLPELIFAAAEKPSEIPMKELQ